MVKNMPVAHIEAKTQENSTSMTQKKPHFYDLWIRNTVHSDKIKINLLLLILTFHVNCDSNDIICNENLLN